MTMREFFVIVSLVGLWTCTIGVERCSPVVVHASSHIGVQQPVANKPLRSSKTSAHQETELGISRLSYVGKNNLWAIGQKTKSDTTLLTSYVLYSADGGRSWEKLLTDSEHYFFAVHFTNTQVGWISGGDGLILKTTDGGKVWTRQYAPTDSNLVEIQFVDPNWGWILGNRGEVLRTTDGGLHWESYQIEVQAHVDSLNFSNRFQGWVVGERGQAYQSTDGGVSWRSRGTELVRLLDERMTHEGDFRGVKFVNPKVAFITAVVRPKRENEQDRKAFRKGVVFKTEDGGNSWAVFFEKSLLEIISAEFINQNEAWIVAARDNELLCTIDRGKTWTSRSNRQTRGVVRVQFADSKSGWAITSWGYLFYTSDGGKTWIRATLPETATLSSEAEVGFSAFSIVDKSNVWAIGREGEAFGRHLNVALHSADGGRSWERKLAYSNEHFFDIHFLTTQLGWIVGSGGTILKSNDGGESWVRQKSPTRSTLTRIQFLNAREGWVMGIDGEFLSTEDGETWQSHKFNRAGPFGNELSRSLNSFSFGDKFNGWIVGEDAQAYQSTDGGVSWQPRRAELIGLVRKVEGVDLDFKEVKFLSPKTGLILAQISERVRNGFLRSIVIFQTKDGGETWNILTELEEYGFVRAQFLSEAEGWIVVRPGRRLLHTLDGGKSYTEISVPADVDFPLIYFLDSNTGWVVSFLYGFSASSLHTADGGKKWSKRKLRYIVQPTR